MSIEPLNLVPALLPAEFFAMICKVEYSKTAPATRAMRAFLLPDTSELLGEEAFAQMALCWNDDGIYVDAHVDKPLEEVSFPHFSRGDALELFFDTRDVKTAGFATRFCHHFVILPQAIQGVQAQEMTHFRTEDTHPLCDPKDIRVETTLKRGSYILRTFIPAHCLHGFDPKGFDRMGFTYRLHRFAGPPQHFSVSSSHFSLEQSPRLWASLILTNTKGATR